MIVTFTGSLIYFNYYSGGHVWPSGFVPWVRWSNIWGGHTQETADRLQQSATQCQLAGKDFSHIKRFFNYNYKYWIIYDIRGYTWYIYINLNKQGTILINITLRPSHTWVKTVSWSPMTTKGADYQRPPETISDEMGSSHIYFVIGDYSRTSHTTGEQQSVQVGGIAKTCLKMVGDWSPMGGDLHAMAGNSHRNIVR